MSTTLSSLGNHGAKPTIEYDGRVWEISYLDDKILAKFEMELIDREMRKLIAKKPLWSEEKYQAACDQLEKDIDSDAFAFSAPRGREFAVTQEGAKVLMCLLTGADLMTVVGMSKDKSDEFNMKLALAVRMSLPASKR